MRPADVTLENQHLVYETLYLKKPRHKKAKPYLFQVGEKIRISYKKGIFDREGRQTYTEQVYTIVSRYRKEKVNMYKIKDCEGETLVDSFYEPEMTKVNMTDNSLYKIDRVTNERVDPATGIRMVKVVWQGYPERCSTWEPKSAIIASKKAV